MTLNQTRVLTADHQELSDFRGEAIVNIAADPDPIFVSKHTRYCFLRIYDMFPYQVRIQTFF